MKSGDILGGLASATNTVTGIVSGLASNQRTKLPTNAVNTDNTVGKDNLKAAQANNNFYANIGVNLGFNKSSSNSNSHSESGVVTIIKGKDENSSIIYNNVKNVEYVGTQAQDTKFIYNNVEDINKTAVELNNSYSSTGKSSGISTGVTIGYGDGTQTEFNAVIDLSILGVSKGVTESIFGYDLITGEELDLSTRIMGIIAATEFFKVDIAYRNKIVTGRYWKGTTPSGIKVEGYIAPNTTVFPLQ